MNKSNVKIKFASILLLIVTLINIINLLVAKQCPFIQGNLPNSWRYSNASKNLCNHPINFNLKFCTVEYFISKPSLFQLHWLSSSG